MAGWRFAALGAFGGAMIALALVFGAAAFGYFPHDPRREERVVRDYLLAHPTILLDMQNRILEQQSQEDERAEVARQAAVKRLGVKALIDSKVAYVTGPADARTTVVEFFDYNCVHCRNTFPVLQAFYEANKDKVRFAFVEFPIFGKDSTAAARAAIAARRQGDKYVAFSFAMMSDKAKIDADTLTAAAQAAGLDLAKLAADMRDPAIDKTIAAGHELARRIGIDGTPTFVVNGKVHSGEIDAETLEKMTRG